MKRKIYLMIIIPLILLSVIKIDAQTWERIDTNLPGIDSLGITAEILFTGRDNGWLYTAYQKEVPNGVFYKKLYRTNNGGISWITKRTEINREFYRPKLFSIEPNFFYMTYTRYSAFFSSNALFTINNGATWDSTTAKNEGSQYGFTGIHFFDEKTGIAIDNHTWVTTDGGFSWTKRDSMKTDFMIPLKIQFINEKRGWMIGDSPIATDAGSIANTIDGGKIWNYQDTRTAVLYGIHFIDSLKGFAVGTNWNSSTGFIYKTIDGGNSWQHKQLISSGVFYDIGFIDNKNGWITGLGKILRTSDGGETWTTQVEGIESELRKLMILKKDKVAYVFGNDYNNKTHTFMRADLTNITDIKNEPAVLPNKYYLANNYPNPFNPTTEIKYSLPKSGYTKLDVYDALGRFVRSLVNSYQNAGSYQIQFNANELPSGVYFYNLITGSNSITKKMLLIK